MLEGFRNIIVVLKKKKKKAKYVLGEVLAGTALLIWKLNQKEVSLKAIART